MSGKIVNTAGYKMSSSTTSSLDGEITNQKNLLASDLSGQILGDFQLLRKIGQGGMGQVYLGTQLSLKRQVAIKLLKAEFAANEVALKRFKAEAEAVAKLSHANIVQVYAIGEVNGLHFMALEYVEGKNLKEYINRKGPLELSLTLSFMRQILAALQRASELGFVHRDIKPENILLTRKGEAKVTDFGLSRCFGSDEPLNLTQTGVTMGTPLYMSPEQVQGKAVDPRSDIYSFGITCYHMLAGEPPFRGTTAFEVALHHVQTQPRPLTDFRPELSAELLQIINKMIAKKTEDRYQSPREILRDLNKLRDNQPIDTIPTATPLSQSGSRNISQSASATDPFAGIDLSPAPIIYPLIEPAVPKRGWKKKVVIFGGGFLLLSILRGGADSETSEISANPSEVVLESHGSLAEIAFREQEKGSLRKIDDKSYRLEVAIDESLKLVMLYIDKKKFDEANQFLDSMPKRVAFQDTGKSGFDKLARITLSVGIDVLKNLGKGIVLAYQDKPKESNAIIRETIMKTRLLKKGEFSSVDPILKNYPSWGRELSNAIDRNFKNFGDEGMDPFLDHYRDALPSSAGESKK
jgi:eukaryotic-like serine/threonine-protein kinase